MLSVDMLSVICAECHVYFMVMLSVAMLCHHAECRCAECRGAKYYEAVERFI